MKYSLTVLLVFLTWISKAQRAEYSYILLPQSAKVAALGGVVVSKDDEVAMAFHNPATIRSEMSGNAYFMANPYFADIGRYVGGVAFNVGGLGPIATSISYLDYGTFERTDPTGQEMGTFSGGDFLFQMGKSFTSSLFSLGISLKYAHSNLESYQSSAVMMDVGGLFRHPTQDLTVGMVFQNMGIVFNDYQQYSRSKVPFDVAIGTTFKPQYMPLRFSLTAKNMVQVQERIFVSENEEPSQENIDRLFRYINLGTELILGSRLSMLLGYNHQRKQELKLNDQGFGAGFSWGFALDLKKLDLNFSRMDFGAAGGTTFIALGVNMKEWRKNF